MPVQSDNYCDIAPSGENAHSLADSLTHLTSLREEPGVDGVEALLRDETRGALGLEAAVDALHLGHVETAAET